MTTTPDLSFDEVSEGGRDKRVVVLGGVAAAAVLGFAGYHFLLAGGSSTDEVESLGLPKPSVTKKVAPTATKAKTPAKAKPASVPAATTVKLGRDPFLALYTVPVAAAPAAGSGDTTTGTTTTPGTTTGSTGGVTTSAPYSLALKSLTASSFTFTYGGATKSVVQGQKFGKYGELVVLSTAKNAKGAVVGALIQVGDDDPVTIKLGEKLTVL